jgi:LysM repeat protein
MRSVFSSVVIAMLLIALAALPAVAGAAPLLAAGPPTAYLTATPLPDGKILYTVQEGDTLWKISAITGVSIDDLERLNNIHREDPLQVGTTLILAVVTPTVAQPTLAFLPTATPSPLPVTGKGEICVSFYDDLNGDASWQTSTEDYVAGGQVSVALAEGTEVGTYTTDGVNEPHCFTGIPAGKYNIAAAAPKGYNPTASMNQQLTLEPGVKVYISFPVQSSKPVTTTDGGGSAGVGSLWLGLIGLVFLGGAGFIIYRVMRPRRLDRW